MKWPKLYISQTDEFLKKLNKKEMTEIPINIEF